MKQGLIERFKEPSTWRGIVLLVTALGIPMNPELKDAVVTAGLAVVGLIGVLTQDR